MKRAEVNVLELGFYTIHWKSGGSSLAAVGMNSDGSRWLAPINWVAPAIDRKVWKTVKSVTRLNPR